MGRRGPKRTSQEVLERRGSWRAKVRTPEPKAAGSKPNPPVWLKGEALAEWRRLMKDLLERGLLSSSYRSALVIYCAYWAQFVTATRQLEGQPLTVIVGDKNPMEIPNPLLSVQRKAAELVHKMGAQFGYSPLAKNNLSGDKAKDEAGTPSALAAYLQQGQAIAGRVGGDTRA